MMMNMGIVTSSHGQFADDPYNIVWYSRKLAVPSALYIYIVSAALADNMNTSNVYRTVFDTAKVLVKTDILQQKIAVIKWSQLLFR